MSTKLTQAAVSRFAEKHSTDIQDLPPNPVSRAVRMNKEVPRKWALDAQGLGEA